MSEITRLLYESGEVRSQSARVSPVGASGRAQSHALMAGRSAGPSESVPVPLTADIWSEAIFHRRVAPRRSGADDHRRSAGGAPVPRAPAARRRDAGVLRQPPGLLARIYERSAPIFAAFAGAVHVRDNRVVPAGGDDAVALWEAVAIEKVTRAERFLTQLLEINDGRVAYLYDVIGQLDAPRRAFVLGMWIPGAAVRLERFKTLALTASTASGMAHARRAVRALVVRPRDGGDAAGG